MNAHDAIRLSIDMGNMIATSYVADLTDADLLRRPAEGCNHINWQLGHLIRSEHDELDRQIPGVMPPLPAGFADKYTSETAAVDDPAKLCTKAELMAAYEAQRAGTLQALEKTTATDLDRATGVEYAPNLGAAFALQGSHWLMHVGQWAVVRRQLGRKPLF
jgi:hypothetical protein